MSGASIVAPVPTIDRASPPDPNADAVVTEGLRRHLRPLWGSSGRLDVAWYLRDDEGRVVGGILGHLAWVGSTWNASGSMTRGAAAVTVPP